MLSSPRQKTPPFLRESHGSFDAQPCGYFDVLFIDTGYLIVNCVKEGEMLSESWDSLCYDQNRRANLFTGLARIMLSLARVHFPRIGSLTIDNYGRREPYKPSPNMYATAIGELRHPERHSKAPNI
jgi:hypothetical protein